MNSAEKILSPVALARWRQQLRDTGRRLAVTNGCFDLLHVGHVTYLEAARHQADALLVGVNSDDAVRGLKGPGRPVNSEADRALDDAKSKAVCIQKRAQAALALAESIAKGRRLIDTFGG